MEAEERRAAAGDEEDDQVVLAAAGEEFENALRHVLIRPARQGVRADIGLYLRERVPRERGDVECNTAREPTAEKLFNSFGCYQCAFADPDEINATSGETIPFSTNVQLFMLETNPAFYRGADIDQPRNLAKSVRVEQPVTGAGRRAKRLRSARL